MNIADGGEGAAGAARGGGGEAGGDGIAGGFAICAGGPTSPITLPLTPGPLLSTVFVGFNLIPPLIEFIKAFTSAGPDVSITTGALGAAGAAGAGGGGGAPGGGGGGGAGGAPEEEVAVGVLGAALAGLDIIPPNNA